MSDRRRSISIVLMLCVILGSCCALPKDLLVGSEQRLGPGTSWGVALGDLDGDGDLDAVVADLNTGAEIWLNDGSGSFADSGQHLGLGAFVAIADLDVDGYPDVLTAGWDQAVRVWWSSETGLFDAGETPLASSGCLALGVGDLTGNGLPDVFVGNIGADHLIVNEGSRCFTDSGERFGDAPTGGVAIGDLDGDGDSDVLAAGWDEPGHVWTNDGTGTLTAHSELDVAAFHVHGAVLADFDGDGDLDAFFALAGGLCCRTLWLNDGTAVFAPRADDFGAGTAQSIAVADLDSDGYLDIVLGIGTSASRQPSQIWLGHGDGFADSSLHIGEAFSGGVAVGDLDGDEDLDLFISFNRFSGSGYVPHPNEVWLNTSADGEE